MAQAPVLIDDRKVDPRIVGAVARGPDDCVDLDLSSVVGTDRAPGDGRSARFQFYAITARYLAGARADQRVPIFQPLPEARFEFVGARSLVARAYEDYAADNVDYFLASSEGYGAAFAGRAPADYIAYQTLFTKSEEVAAFRPTDETPGPELRLFRIKGE